MSKVIEFNTIDWIKLTRKERARLNTLKSKGFLLQFWDAFLEIVLVLVIGIACGIAAAFVNTSESWLSDLREGFCKDGNFYLNRKMCCMGQGFLLDNNAKCVVWHEWSSDSLFLSWFMYLITGVLFASISALLVKQIAPFSTGSGIPEIKTILGGFSIPGFLAQETLLVKCVGLALSVGSGLYFGKEGPMIHVACCICSILTIFSKKYNQNAANRRDLLSAACATGVSVAFSAPIGGILYSLEGVSYYFPQKTMFKSFLMATVGALTLKLLTPLKTEFQVSGLRDWYYFEIPFFIILGIISGILSGFFIKWNLIVNTRRKNGILARYPIAEVSFFALVTALLSFPLSFLRSNTADLVENLFQECSHTRPDIYGLCSSPPLSSISSLLFSALFILAFSILSFGIKVPSGIFVPSMAIGACLGRALGIFLQLFYSSPACPTTTPSCGITPGTYAIIGAAAMLAGVTRMTISLVVIIFELTGSISYVLPVMIVILISKWVASWIEHDSIFDALIHLNKYPYLANHFRPGRRDQSAADIMTPASDLVCIQTTGQTKLEITELLAAHPNVNGFPILSAGQNLIVNGYISRVDLEAGLSGLSDLSHVHFKNVLMRFGSSSVSVIGGGVGGGSFSLEKWIDRSPMLVHPKMRLEIVVDLFRKMGMRYVLVAIDGKLLGILTKKDLLRYA